MGKRNKRHRIITDIEDIEKDCEDSDETYNIDANIYISAIVPTTDDSETPSLTFRVILIGSLWNILLALSNSLLELRTNKFQVPSSVATLLAYPMGLFMAKFMSTTIFDFFGLFDFTLNPGPFSIKEHVLITIIASAGAAFPYGLDNVVVHKYSRFLGDDGVNLWNSLAFVLSVQLIGFGMAGFLRRFLVKPVAMYWPATLGTVALFVGFHEKRLIQILDNGDHKLSRYQWFWIVVCIMFLYSWIPSYFVTTLQSVALVCLLTSNPIARFLGSTTTFRGVGIGSLTFDWNLIGGGYLTTPFWASFQFFISNIIWTWILVPCLFYSNVFGADKLLKLPKGLPGEHTLNSYHIYDKNGDLLDPIRLMDKKTFNLNETMYESVKPIYMTTYFAISYGQSFIALVSACTHVFLWYGRTIKKQFKEIWLQIDKEKDIHNRLMRQYPDIPDWVFLVFVIVMIVVHIAISVFTPFSMPIWSVFLCLAISMFFLLPIGVIAAITGMELGSSVISEFIIGILLPGETISVLSFKSLGANAIIQSLKMIENLKLGHYLKINPIHVIGSLFYGTILGSIISTSAIIWAENGLASVLFTKEWRLTGIGTFYSTGIIWGSIGPLRMFAVGAVYQNLMWFFLIGFLAPFIPWIGNKIYKSNLWQFINIPVLAYGTTKPGKYQVHVLMPFIVAWIFQRYIFINHHSWWRKYNYITAIGLDVGTAITVLMVAVLQNAGIFAPKWACNPENAIDYYCFDMNWQK